uniref:Collagen type VI alpha 6 chain n=1 Tax=Callorhinchus milii TaxID=7868 RepID=A0A4W3GB04_CALMI
IFAMNNKYRTMRHRLTTTSCTYVVPSMQGSVSSLEQKIESSVADIVFLVDGSWSIGSQNFRRVREFLYTLVNAFDIGEDKVRVGLVQYSSTPRTEFLLNSYSSKTEILQYLQQLPYKGGGTRTGLGLNFILNNHFTESAGSRAARGIPQVAIVLTDGKSQDRVGLPAQALKNKGIIVIAIGIRDAVEKELYDIASDPPETYVYNMPDFAALRGISQVIIQLLCSTVEEGASQVTQVLQEFEMSPGTIPRNDSDWVLLSVIVLSLACRRATVADIVFMVDGSTSINDENFEDVKAFLSTFVSGLDIGRDKIRIGLVQYSDNPNTEFLLKRFSSKQDILNYLQRLTQKRGGTNTRTALEFLQTQHFIPSAGSRKTENIQQFAVLITDGGSTTEVVHAARQLKQGSVTTYVVGINVQDQKELQDISSKPTEKYIYDVPSFNMLKALAANVLESVCMTIEAHNQGLWPRYFLLLLIILLNLILQKSFIQTNTFIGTSDVYQPTSWPKNAKSGRSFAFRGGQALRTGSAIDYLLRIFFTESAGSRKKEGVPQIAIIITSASSQDDVIVPARALRNHGVKVISIGVRNSELTEMKKIAFLPNFPFVFQISAFSALVQLSDRISTAMKTIVRNEFLHRELKAPEGNHFKSFLSITTFIQSFYEVYLIHEV